VYLKPLIVVLTMQGPAVSGSLENLEMCLDKLEQLNDCCVDSNLDVSMPSFKLPSLSSWILVTQVYYNKSTDKYQVSQKHKSKMDKSTVDTKLEVLEILKGVYGGRASGWG